MKKRTIEISEETYTKIKDMVSAEELLEVNELDDIIGQKFFFRTVTYHIVGLVTHRITGTNIFRVSNASWVADSGRFMNAIKDGILAEVEPVGDAFVNLDSVTDFFPWTHDLPTEQK